MKKVINFFPPLKKVEPKIKKWSKNITLYPLLKKWSKIFTLYPLLKKWSKIFTLYPLFIFGPATPVPLDLS